MQTLGMLPVHNEGELRTAHDVRHLTKCASCGGVGDKRQMLTNLPGAGMDGYHHGLCVVRGLGADAVVALPDVERDKLKLSDTGVALMRRLLDTREEGRRSTFAVAPAAVGQVAPLSKKPKSKALSAPQRAALQLCLQDSRGGAIETWRMSLATLRALMARGHLEMRAINYARDATQFAYITEAGRAAVGAPAAERVG